MCTSSGGCEIEAIHEESVERARAGMPPEEQLFELAELFKVIGDSTRIRILKAIEIQELCVCDIAYLLNMTQSAISHQLRVLKQAKLVKSRREGKTVFYAPDDDHVRMIIDQGLDHICHIYGEETE
ncbi:MAG TPA: winged helix-turn-helix transcriptional regulator [Clostridiaceae bacterium]|nr:winged helix-turn-helix transcriptional regulator [Clostridiaceae bacterium]